LEQSPRVLIVGPGGILAEALVRLLGRLGTSAVHVQSSDIEKVIEHQRPTTVLLEATASPESLSQCADIARQHCRTVQVLLLGTDDDRDTMLAAKLNAAGIVSGQTTTDELIAAVKGLRTMRTASQRCEPIAGIRRRGGALERLTNRETEILRALMSGASNARVAGALAISIHTVRTHVQNILAKLNATTRLEAVLIGFRGGLRPLDDPPRASPSSDPHAGCAHTQTVCGT
jgi:DNA-binding NarL/FixJ family response regulator